MIGGGENREKKFEGHSPGTKKSQRPSSRKKTWCSRQDLRQFRPAVFLQAKPILKVEVPLWHTEGREIGNGINKACMVARC